MKQIFTHIFAGIFYSTITLSFSGCFQQETEFITLLDEDLSRWDIYLSYKFKDGYNGEAPLNEIGEPLPPLGLNPPKQTVFKTVEENGETILRVSGEYYGSVTTKESYRNYHLRLKFKWGDQKHPPRLNLLKDSGILYHAQGPHGAEWWRSWKLSQEFQIMEGHLGDYWSQANSAIDVRAYIPEYIKNPAADLSQDFISVGANEDIQGYVMRSVNREIPDDWNTLELIAYEGQSLHIVNGEIVMALRNSRYVENGESKPLIEGQIQLQSEAAELFYKEIELKTIESLPPQYTRIFLD